MKISLASVADFVSVSVGDKLNLLGVFDTIFAKQFPAVHHQMAFVVRFMFEYEDSEQDLEVGVHLEDADGQRLLELPPARFKSPKVAPGDFPTKNLILNLQNVSFGGPGTYKFVVNCGPARAEVPLRVVQQS